jgi:hypothetical protein
MAGVPAGQGVEQDCAGAKGGGQHHQSCSRVCHHSVIPATCRTLCHGCSPRLLLQVEPLKLIQCLAEPEPPTSSRRSDSTTIWDTATKTLFKVSEQDPVQKQPSLIAPVCCKPMKASCGLPLLTHLYSFSCPGWDKCKGAGWLQMLACSIPASYCGAYGVFSGMLLRCMLPLVFL